ncbi:hypothetical protein ACQRBN_04565 [Bariatricus sp. SGI.154]|uniref:hypothetical protein n=1 Tax=Bariatricus sp. SGI.154 TaxID=3420549 RepID=UPI003CFE3277
MTMTADEKIARAAEKIVVRGEVIGMPARAYKDRIFRMIFKEKKELLELYNAMNGTEYTKEEDLTVTTLENALYIGMKNDVSFVLYDKLTLYEHQSTQNPNMPLRDLFYVANVYSNLTRDDNLYSSTRVKIPEPRFVVFYNGTEEMEERQVFRLSDLYETRSDDPNLELKVTELNINPGHNEELMEKCRTLREYMILVDRIRRYSQETPFAEAVERAVDECIREGILEEFLRKNRSEVISVSIFEYDEERHLQQEREEAWAKGREAGRELGREEGRELGEKRINMLHDYLIKGNRIEDLRRSIVDVEYQEQLMEEYGIE